MLNASDFPDLATAIATAADGDRVYVPGALGPYTAPAGGWQITKSIELYGDGQGHTGNLDGTTFLPSAPGQSGDVFVIAPPNNGEIQSVFLHDFKITNKVGVNKDGRHGIRCLTSAVRRIWDLRLKGIVILNLTGDGFHLEGTTQANGLIRSVAMTSCAASLCDGFGLLIKNVLDARVARSSFLSNGNGGSKCEASGVALYNAAFDNNSVSPTAPQGQLFMTGCHLALVDACHFENFHAVTGGRQITTACEFDTCKGAAMIGASYVHQPGMPGDSTGIRIPATNGPVVVLPNRFVRVHQLINVLSGAVDFAVLPQFVDANGTTGPGIVTVPGTPNGGLLGAPLVAKIGAADDLTGLIIPSGATPPTTSVRDGMLFYDSHDAKLLVRISTWRTIKTV